MTRLVDIVRDLGGELRGTAADLEVRDVRLDSRRVEPGDLFCALPGTRTDGSRYAADAVARGAVAVLAPEPLGAQLDVPVWVHPEARRIAGLAAAEVHGRPSSTMCVIAVTGTNGKTTTAHFAGHLLAACGLAPAVLGTTGYALAGGVNVASTHTTPDATELQRLLARHREAGGDACALEVSSHALDQERIAGLDVDVAVFTNLSRDHLDYHPSLDAYARAKARLFEGLAPGKAAVVFAGDPESSRMAAAAERAGARVAAYAVGEDEGTRPGELRAELRASRLRGSAGGTQLLLTGMGITRTELCLCLRGSHNVENAIAATAAVLMSGASPSKVLEGLATISPPPGRLEEVPTGERKFTLLVDYAHSEAALRRVLGELRGRLARGDEKGRLWVVFGCGGDRDQGKRAHMGRAADELADVCVLTSDNPRSEEPERIIADIVSGMEVGHAERIVEPDRRSAIRRAVRTASPGDVVLIAGKGHETTQVVGTTSHPFDDRVVAVEEMA